MASATGHNDSLLYVWDRNSGRRFLVDTGAEVSVLPATGLDTRTNEAGPSLKAANGSSIKTYGVRSTKLRFASRQYKWNFVVADVSLGADFLRANSLLVDLKGKRLVDAEIYLSIPLGKTVKSAPHLDAIAVSTDPYDMLLAEFPDITIPNFTQSSTKHGVEHFITTKGPPVHARARRLPPDKLATAKAEFSRYPVPHIQDFAANLEGARIFSKIDLVRGYHQIPVAAADVAKTAIITPFGLYEFLRMPFGLKNSAQAFQRFMDTVCQGLDFVFVYIDDILVASRNAAEQKVHL